MEWPEVVILLVTFKRTKYALQVVEGLKAHLHYPNLWWHIADDGSGEDHQKAILEAIDRPGYVSLTDANQRGGTGYNRNIGLRAAFKRTPYVLHIEDDWELEQHLDLREAVGVLMKNDDIGMVRFGYLEAGHVGKSVSLAGSGRVWWDLQKDSGHTHIFAGHPHLLHQRLHDAYGMYPEKLLPGPTEGGFAAEVIKRKGPRILYPTWRDWMFGHIGTIKAEAYL